MKWLREILTDYDNRTYDTGRVAALFLLVSLVGMQVWAMWRGQQFDAMSFAGGAAAILGALGLAVAGDNHKRPPQ